MELNPRQALAGFDFDGFSRIAPGPGVRGDLGLETKDLYVSQNAAGSVAAGSNHYGTFYTVELTENEVRLESYGSLPRCHATVMGLLQELFVRRGETCTWWGFKLYMDSGECSATVKGTEAELRGLFSANPQSTEDV